ncbi:hypothetical protein V1264_011293 [Littorina saxatilis]|uniref:Uncharacterized protein n=1 Tax=Littorina saxatilis TaxID=31220 RepID=A0AAN9BUS3_9CAEN
MSVWQESDSRAHPAGLWIPQCSEGHHLTRGDSATKEPIRPQRGLGEDSTFRPAVRTDDLTANDKKKKKKKKKNLPLGPSLDNNYLSITTDSRITDRFYFNYISTFDSDRVQLLNAIINIQFQSQLKV